MAKKGSEFELEMNAIQTALEAIASLKAEQRQFALDTIAARLNLAAPASPAGTSQQQRISGGGSNESQGSLGHPRDFLRDKKPQSAGEQLTCLAFFLLHARNIAKFKTNDLIALNNEANGAHIGNARQTADNTFRVQGFFAPAGKGCRRITTLGESVVKALPNREAVKLAIHENRPKGRRKRAKRE